MRMTEIKVYAGVVVMILFLGLSLLSKNTLYSALATSFSLLIGVFIFRNLYNKKNEQK